MPFIVFLINVIIGSNETTNNTMPSIQKTRRHFTKIHGDETHSNYVLPHNFLRKPRYFTLENVTITHDKQSNQHVGIIGDLTDHNKIKISPVKYEEKLLCDYLPR